jgi:hypothetical protein
MKLVLLSLHCVPYMTIKIGEFSLKRVFLNFELYSNHYFTKGPICIYIYILIFIQTRYLSAVSKIFMTVGAYTRKVKHFFLNSLNWPGTRAKVQSVKRGLIRQLYVV